MLAPTTFALFLLSAARSATAALTESSLTKHVDSLALDYEFGPVKEAYWTGYPHHRRTPFALSPDGKTAYLAYLDSSDTDVHIQQVDPTTFAATGTTVTVSGAKEAGGLVAHDDGFALLTNEALPSGTANAPADSTPVPVLYRYTNGNQTWKTFLGGPGVHTADGLSASPDLNGDLVYSAEAGYYGAYFVVTDYSGDASGHYGDSIEYVSEDGTLETIDGASSSWGCSHNTGIAFEAADAAPFASICAEDQGAIWLNTGATGMENVGTKISNENTTNGASNEAMGGMSGSYSGLARFASTTKYIFTWVSRGAIDLTENTWMGDGYTNAQNRTNPRHVAIALFSDKNTLDGTQATSEVGATSGDSQVNWITTGANDCSNAHAATFGESNALITWEEISDPICDYLAMGCRGTFAGTSFQQVDSTGAKVGDAFSVTDTYVAGDMVTMTDGSICWPYVSMTWDLSQAVAYEGSTTTTQKISFACMSLSGNSTSTTSESASTSSTSLESLTSTAASSTAPNSTPASTTIPETTSTLASTTPTTLLTVARSSSAAEQVGATAAASSATTPALASTEAVPTVEPSVLTPGAFTAGAFTPGAFTPGAFTPGAWPTAFPSGSGFAETDASASENAQSSEEQEGSCEVQYVYV